MSGLRHRVRITALKVLFEVDLTDHPIDAVVERQMRDEQYTAEGQQFLQRLVFGVWEHRNYLDGILVEAAPSWPIDQMPGVDKAILRIALYELLIDTLERTPLKAVINEAVEIAKRFGSDNSGRFVNGVLGYVVSHYVRDAPDT